MKGIICLTMKGTQVLKRSLLVSFTAILFFNINLFATAPDTITDLAATQGTRGGDINLSWRSPGPDVLLDGSYYWVRYSTFNVDASWSEVQVATSGVAVGTKVYHTLKNLIPGVTYYMKNVYENSYTEWSGLSNMTSAWAFVDSVAPAQVNDLSASMGSAGGEINLSWSSPGDDGSTYPLDSGSSFRIQYATWDAFVWSTSTITNVITVSTFGVTPNAAVSYVLGSLPGGTTYFIRIGYKDEIGNWAVPSGTQSAVSKYAFFNDIQAGLAGYTQSVVAWGDYDNDGDLDLALSGKVYGLPNYYLRIYKNTAGSFTEVGGALTGTYQGSICWGDYDNDGDLDLLVSGNNGAYVTVIFKNNAGTFSSTNVGLTGIRYGASAFGDYNNDGCLDVAVSGFTDGVNFISKIFKNNGDGTFTDSGFSIQALKYSSLAWGDYDNDGDMDLAISGNNGAAIGGQKTYIYRNDGNAFNDIQAGLTGAQSSSMAWGDYDNDGDLDLCVSGSGASSKNTIIYKNEGSDVFTDIGASLAAVSDGSVAWGDFDSDGDLDMAVLGVTQTPIQYLTKFYRNDSGNFNEFNSGVSNLYQGAIAFGDYDGDNKLDVAVCGNDGNASGNYTKIYKNLEAAANNAPSVPSGLTTIYLKALQRLQLQWDAANDTETTANGLQYEIRAATNPITDSLIKWVISPSTGIGRTPFMGNYPHSKLSASQNGVYIKSENLLNYTTYYWQVRSIDTAFRKSNWSAQESKYLDVDVQPPATVTNLTGLQGSNRYEIKLSWSMPGDDGSTSALSPGSKFIIQQSSWSGVTWTTSAPSGIFIVSTSGVTPGTMVTYTLTGITSGMNYYYKLWVEDEQENIAVSPSNLAWVQSDVVPPAKVTGLTVSAGDYEGKIDLNWSAPGDDGWELTLGAGSEFWVHYNTNAASISRTSSQIKISTSGISPNTPAHYALTGLLAGTTYYIGVWYKDPVGNWAVEAGTASCQSQVDVTPPATVENLNAFTGTAEGEVRLSWGMPGDNLWADTLQSGSVFTIESSTDPGITWSTAPAQNVVSVSTQGVSPGTIVYYTLTGLSAGSTYYFKIWHTDESQNISLGLSNTATAWAQIDITAPGTVSNLSAFSGPLEGDAVLTWNMPGDDGWNNPLSTGSRFVVQSSTDSLVTWSTAAVQGIVAVSTKNVIPNTLVNYTLTGLYSGQLYYFRIWHIDEMNNISAYSNMASSSAQHDITAPADITDLAAISGEAARAIRLMWSSPGDDLWNNALSAGSGYQIQYSSWIGGWAQINISTSGVTPKNTVSYSITGLKADTTYYAKVYCRDEINNWSTLANTATGWTLKDTTPPQDVNSLAAAASAKNGEFILNWNSPGDDGLNFPLEQGARFVVAWSTDSTITWTTSVPHHVEVSTSGIMPLTPVGYTVTGLELPATYYAKIWYADNAGNWTNFSNTASVWAKGSLAITSMNPDNGANTTSVNVTINGAGFLNGSMVKLRKTGQTDITATGINYAAVPTQITCNFDLKLQTTGYWDLEISSAFTDKVLFDVLPNAMNLKPLKVNSITPATGDGKSVVSATIAGDGFVASSQVKLSKPGETDIPGTEIVVVDTGTITCKFDIVGKTTGKWSVTVSTTIGATPLSGTLSEGFEITSTVNKTVVLISKDTGGTILINPESGNISLEIPAGGFSEDVSITLSTDTVAASEQNTVSPINIGLRITNDKGLQPLKGLTVTLWYRDSDIAGMDESNLSIALYDETWARWVPLESTVYPDENKLVAVINHLSRFAIVSLAPAADLNGVNVYPNPFRPSVHSQFTIENLTEGAELKLFTVSRELVRTIEYSDKSGRVNWDGKNDSGKDVASGVYILYIKSSSGAKKKMKVIVEQ